MIGKSISHYKIIEKLGEGGMGEVFLAEDTKLKRKVALKFLPKEFTKNKDAVERFQREAQAAAALNHAHIVTIYEINQHENQTYIAMEYVKGQTLKEKIASRPLPFSEAIDMSIQIAEGLNKAHKKNIVHRDIKPANIFITDEEIVKILDFGLAKLKGVSQLTREKSTLGTTHYLSPEQALGKEVDHRSDIWSLGVILYEMLTGQLPFKGDYEQAIIYSIMNEPLEPITGLRSGAPLELEQIINKCLSKEPTERYQHMDDLITDLKRTSKQIIKPEKSTPPSKIKKKRKNRYFKTIILPSIIVIVGLITYFLIQNVFLPQPEKSLDSIAVLPLENLSGDPGQDYFSDGMTEALITELSRIKALKVISRTSVMRFKNTRESLPEIARQLKVAAVVEGSVLKAGDKVRITTQLIEAASDKHLWAESYERDLKDILSLQKEVARTIAGQVKATLTPAEKISMSEVTTIDPKAHEAFLKGQYFLNQVSVKGAYKAIELFRQVIEMKPDFAPAYAMIAVAYDNIVGLNAIPPEQGWNLVREWAEKALRIDKNNSDAYMLMGDVKFSLDWDWPGAEANYKKAIQLNPNNFIAYNWYGTFLSSMGRNSEALAMSKKALELGPLSIEPYYNGVYIRMDNRQMKQAEDLMRKAKELFPHHPLGLGIHGMLLMRESKYREALRLFEAQLHGELSPGMKIRAKSRMGFALAQIGEEQKAREILENLFKISKVSNVSPYKIALIYLALNETDKTFTWLERAYNERCDDLVKELKTSPFLDKIRPDPRFQDLLKRMKLDQ